jgi:uncharacterized membrane protein YvbJ
MSNCSNCGSTVPAGVVNCSNCGAALSSSATTVSSSLHQVSLQTNISSSGDMSLRLEKAMRRNELLSYAAAGLGVAILVVLIVISFL